MWLAGICARRRTHFLLLRQKKVSKEKAPLLSVSLRCATGNLRCFGRGACRRTRYALRATLKQLRQIRTRKHARFDAHAAPRPALLGTARREPATRAIAALGLAIAARGACARVCEAERSDGPCQAVHPLEAAPAAWCVRGEHGRRSAHASSSDLPQVSERSAGG